MHALQTLDNGSLETEETGRQLELSDGQGPVGAKAARGGPPNRMNDMAYRDWMKFQKSFFWFTSSQHLIEECVVFFTKSAWPDGRPSKSLIIGVPDFDATFIPQPRIVEAHRHLASIGDVLGVLQSVSQRGERYDFIAVDLRSYITAEESLSSFLREYADTMYSLMRSLLYSDRYCCVLASTNEASGAGFPIPWSIGLACRDHLRLRDEKVGLSDDRSLSLYCLFMQAEDDARPVYRLSAKNLKITRSVKASRGTLIIPAWTIPKPPPRKKNEILHPAKYPETLVAEFIELFTEPGETVLDPMVGTGSTVIAALRSGRNGYGVELTEAYSSIARDRVGQETAPMLFDAEFEPRTKGVIIQGDSTELSEMTELLDVTFDYAITSPPYWSMLTNPGSENQEARRRKGLSLVYSQDDRDLGNVQDYEQFLDLLDEIYNQVASKLRTDGCLTVVVKNVKRNHILYTLAWDLTARLCAEEGRYDYIGTTLWCQDDIGLKPFAVGIHWVSNILHSYCLHFRKRSA